MSTVYTHPRQYTDRTFSWEGRADRSAQYPGGKADTAGSSLECNSGLFSPSPDSAPYPHINRAASDCIHELSAAGFALWALLCVLVSNTPLKNRKRGRTSCQFVLRPASSLGGNACALSFYPMRPSSCGKNQSAYSRSSEMPHESAYPETAHPLHRLHDMLVPAHCACGTERYTSKGWHIMRLSHHLRQTFLWSNFDSAVCQ